MNKFLLWLSSKLQWRMTILGPCDATPYLDRYFLLGHRTSRWAVMLHQFHHSDMDRDLHDHPWGFVSVILSGGYWEHTPWNCIWYPVGKILFRRANWVHRIQITKQPTWTLVIHFRKVRSWGFITRKGWVHHESYNYQEGCE